MTNALKSLHADARSSWFHVRTCHQHCANCTMHLGFEAFAGHELRELRESR